MPRRRSRNPHLQFHAGVKELDVCVLLLCIEFVYEPSFFLPFSLFLHMIAFIYSHIAPQSNCLTDGVSDVDHVSIVYPQIPLARTFPDAQHDQ